MKAKCDKCKSENTNRIAYKDLYVCGDCKGLSGKKEGDEFVDSLTTELKQETKNELFEIALSIEGYDYSKKPDYFPKFKVLINPQKDIFSVQMFDETDTNWDFILNTKIFSLEFVTALKVDRIYLDHKQEIFVIGVQDLLREIGDLL